MGREHSILPLNALLLLAHHPEVMLGMLIEVFSLDGCAAAGRILSSCNARNFDGHSPPPAAGWRWDEPRMVGLAAWFASCLAQIVVS
jgi:hypothetical protein